MHFITNELISTVLQRGNIFQVFNVDFFEIPQLHKQHNVTGVTEGQGNCCEFFVLFLLLLFVVRCVVGCFYVLWFYLVMVFLAREGFFFLV